MKIITGRNLILVILSISYLNSSSQTNLNNQPREYYNTLIKTLSRPDSLFVYEISSSWGSGIAYFISFKDSGVQRGYYLNNNFIYRQLSPRGLMPTDSINNLYQIFYNSESSTINHLLVEINKLKIFQLPKEVQICSPAKNAITDGLEYQFTKFIKDAVFYIRYYEIYEYSKLCPEIKEYYCFIELDRLFQNYFNKSKSIVSGLINEFKSRRTDAGAIPVYDYNYPFSNLQTVVDAPQEPLMDSAIDVKDVPETKELID